MGATRPAEKDSEGSLFKMDVLNLIAKASAKTSIILIQVFASSRLLLVARRMMM